MKRLSLLLAVLVAAVPSYAQRRHRTTSYSISGTISGPAADGTTVTLTGSSSATTTTGSSGTFEFRGLENGTYTVTASNTTATISPSDQVVTIDRANKSGVNFSSTSTSTSTPSTPSTNSSAAFYDDFSGTTLSSNWIAQDVFPDVNNQVGCYLPSADTVNNALVITTTVQTSTCPGGGTQQYASGAVIWSTFSFTYGTVEFKAEMPGGQGTWPAVWLLGTNCRSTSPTVYNANSCNWPNPGSDEIDITEILDSNHTAVNQQVHSATSNAGCTASTSDVSQNYHVYDFIWTSESLTWEIDGKVTCTLPASVVSATPKYLIINTALGGDGGGSISNSTLPQAMHVDYVQVTQ